MKRLGVLGIILLFVGVSLFFSDKSTEKPDTPSQEKFTYKRFFQVARSEITWVLPEVELLVVQSCKGELGDEFGYLRPIPKSIIFLKATKGVPDIVTARLKNLTGSSKYEREIVSRKASDLNHFLLEDSGVLAEHGSLKELVDLDHQKGMRRHEALIEEALWLCTDHIANWTQRDIEMEKLREKILSEATAYIQIAWPIENREAHMEVFFEVDGRTFKADLANDFFRI